MSVRLAEPRPAYCSSCHNTPPNARYVDFDAAHDAGAFVDRETQTYIEGSDDLTICERCLKLAIEVLGEKPELHTRQLREIRRLEIAVEHWRDYAGNLERTLAERPEPVPGTRAAKRKAA